jgi:hypothetical protein
MRLCLYNPHAGLYGHSVYAKLFRKASVPKLGYMLDYLRDRNRRTAIVVDGTVSSFPVEYVTGNRLVLRVVSFVEILLWCLINRVNPSTQTFVFSAGRLHPAQDLLYGMGFPGGPFGCARLAARSAMARYTGKKILHLSHYFTRTATVAGNIEVSGVRQFAAESDVSDNPFFHRFFPFAENVYVQPFALRPRYVKKTEFRDRKNIWLAIGTTHRLEITEYTRDYCNFMGTTNYHRMRRAIYDRRVELQDIVDCRIGEREERPAPANAPGRRWKALRYFRKLFEREQVKYFSFDIVALYNEYKMFVSPEEDVGLPSINFVEGMGCGCAFIGLDHHMYRDIGLADGVNFIAYDGTLEGLRERIRHYQSRSDELERIADAGCRFVHDAFSEERVRERLWADLSRYVDTGTLTSSFRRQPA